MSLSSLSQDYLWTYTEINVCLKETIENKRYDISLYLLNLEETISMVSEDVINGFRAEILSGKGMNILVILILNFSF